jgi:hypothetical protein
MTLTAERHTWVNTMVGMLDTAFALSDEELVWTTDMVGQLLGGLRIPERGDPDQLPAAVALELIAGHFTDQIYEPRDAGVFQIPRAALPAERLPTLEAWREALLNLVTSSYQLTPGERFAATTVLDDILTGLGLPARAPRYVPDDVLRAHLSGA